MVRSQTRGGNSVSAANGNRKSAAFSEKSGIVTKKLTSATAAALGFIKNKLREFRSRSLQRIKRFTAGAAAIFRNAFRNTKNPVKIAARLVSGSFAAIKRHSNFAKTVLCTLAPIGGAAVLLFTVMFWNNGMFALKVTLDGNHIAYIKSEAVYNEAQNKLASRLIGSEDDLNLKADFSFTKVNEDEISDANTLVNKLLECSSLDLTEACGLYVDDKFVAACNTSDEISGLLNEKLAAESAKDQSVSVAFYSKIELLTGLYKQDSILDTTGLSEIISSDASPLSIQSTKTVKITQDVAFTTIEIEDKTKEKSYLKVTSEGKNGQETVTESIIYINGIESQRIIENSEVIKNPVDKKIVKGTGEAIPAPVVAAAPVTNGDGIATGGYTWPVEKAGGHYISSYWGDGRGHRGIDIAVPSGTKIYAADGGTVTKAGNHFKYGLYFIIDHGDGVTTLYSHCSAVNVKEGQTVTRGQTLAAVGRTGNATGNHLHFEVMINNVKVDPMPYFK